MRTTSGSVLVSTIGLASAAVLTCALACSKGARHAVTEPTVPVASIALNPQQVTLAVGDSVTVTASPEDSSGSDLTDATVSWASSAPAVATVTPTGIVHAMGAGSATVTATSGAAQAQLPVSVSLIPVARVVLTPSDSLACEAGGTAQFFAKAVDSAGNLLFDRPVSWTSTPTSIATVDSGRVQCLTPGTASITAAIEGKTATGKVAVTAVPVASVSLSPSGMQSCLVAASLQLAATPRDSAGNALSGRPVSWASSAAAVVTVSSTGLVQCVAAGKGAITATVSGQHASDSITVSTVPVASVVLTPAGQQTCSAGTSVPIAATAKDASGNALAGRPVSWSSSAATVATVSSSGTVQCVAPGKTVVTATVETKHAADTMTVTAPSVGSVTVSPSPDTVKVSATSTLKTVIKDKTGKVLTGQTVTWSIAPTTTATITSSGVVTGVAAGTATATATAGGVHGTANILVVPAPSGQVIVPPSMRTPPFDVPRVLSLQPNFAIAVYARIPAVRFMAVTPDGNLLASNPGAGIVYLVRPNPGGDPLVSPFIRGLNLPQDIVFHVIGGTTYLYVSETGQIDRYIYHNGDLTGQSGQVIISGLPDGSSTGLNGSYAHALKDIALDSDDKLYVSLGSSCNVCTGDLTSSPIRGSIYIYNADGTGGRVFATGVRNAEGLAILPGTNTLWTAVNMRDDVPYPGTDGQYAFGAVVPAYVDNHPPDEVMSITDGGNYGWPYCNPTEDSSNGYDNMPFDPAVDPGINDAGQVSCATMTRITKGIQAHSAPLGLTFLQSTSVPAAYRQGALIGLHGSWDRRTPTGYKVIWMPWSGVVPTTGVTPTDFVSGWSNGSSAWGRPVDAVIDAQGNIFISDDASGTIYKVTWGG